MSVVPLIHVEMHESVATLVLDDPRRRNALSIELSSQIVDAVDALESDGAARALIVTGAPPAFCAGADLAQLAGSDETALRTIYAGFDRIVRCTMLTVAAVNGPAVGAGVNMALACDVRLASTEARFDTRFLALGLHPGGGHTWMLRRALPYGTAAAMLLGGDVLTGEDAARVGLAHRCVSGAELLAAARTLASNVAACPPQLVARAKASLARAYGGEYAATVEHELAEQLWSIGEPFFAERVEALRRRISSTP